jgi:hypothetical protein
MKITRHYWFSFLLLLTCIASLKAQTPTDATLMTKGQICLAAIYSHDSWDQYWEGTLLRSNGNIGTLTRQSINPMAILGITNSISVMAAVPWVKTEASGGYIKGTSGFQDWGVWVKAKALDLKAGPGNFTTHVTIGAMGPLSNYLADYGPYSLGLGCTDLSLTGILQYKLNMGLYLRGQTGYHIRGNSSIERNYYYTTHSVYSDKVEMPDAITWGATLGTWLFDDALKIEVEYSGLNTQGGYDIRRQDSGFPSVNMQNTSIGGEIQYYLPGITGFSVIASAKQVQTGRNVGKSTIYSGGLTYFFPVWKSGQEETITN